MSWRDNFNSELRSLFIEFIKLYKEQLQLFMESLKPLDLPSNIELSTKNGDFFVSVVVAQKYNYYIFPGFDRRIRHFRVPVFLATKFRMLFQIKICHSHTFNK